jgi:hypothetical protein
MYELPENDSSCEDAACARGARINDPLPLEEVDFKRFKASGAIVRCPLAVQ